MVASVNGEGDHLQRCLMEHRTAINNQYNLNGAIHIFQMVGDPDCHLDSQSIVLDQVEASSKSEASVGQIPKVHRQEVRLLIKIWIYSKMH